MTDANLELRRPDPVLADMAPDLAALLDGLGIATRTLAHEAVFTVAESQGLDRQLPGAHTKNLFLKDKKSRIFLVVAEHESAVDLKSLHTRIGAQGRLSFAGPDQMKALLGVEPGSVTAFGVVNDKNHVVTLVLDEKLLAHDIWNCHPLTNRATTSIAREDILRVFSATGHEPVTARLDAVEPANGQTNEQ